MSESNEQQANHTIALENTMQADRGRESRDAIYDSDEDLLDRYLEEYEVIVDPKYVYIHSPEHVFEHKIVLPYFRLIISKRNYLGGRYLSALDTVENLRFFAAPSRLIERQKEIAMGFIDDFRDQLTEIASQPYFVDALEQKRKNIPTELSQKIENMRSDASLLECLINSDNQTLAEFVEWNRDFIVAESEAMQPTIEKLKQQFKVRIEKAIREQHLPITLSQLRSRMDDIKVIVVDPVSMHLEEMGGYYESSSRTIYVAATDSEAELESVMYHELLHHISGQTLVEYHAYDPEFEDRDHSPTVVCERTGIAQPEMEDNGPRWINEAVTEQLTQLLLSNEGDQVDFKTITRSQFFKVQAGVYYRDRKALVYMLYNDKKGQLLRTMLGAYFEDMKPETNSSASRTAKFWKQLTSQWGSGIEDIVYKQPLFKSDDDYAKFGEKLAKQRLLIAIFGVKNL